MEDHEELCESLEFVTNHSTTAYMYEPLQNGSEMYGDSSDSSDSCSSEDEGACGGLDADDFTKDTDGMGYPDPSSDSTIPKW